MPIPIETALLDGPEPLSAYAIHPPWRQPGDYLACTGNDALWVVKTPPEHLEATYGRREIFDNSVGRRLGLTMAPWMFVLIDEASLESSRAQLESKAGAAGDKPLPGVYLARKLPDGDGSLCDFMPQVYLRRYPEIARQLGCRYIFDIWTRGLLAHCGIFTLVDGIPMNLGLFGNARLSDPEQRSFLQSHDEAAYRRALLTTGDRTPVDNFIAELCSLTQADLQAAFTDVPLFWRDPDEEDRDIKRLEQRRDWISGLVRSGTFLPRVGEA